MYGFQQPHGGKEKKITPVRGTDHVPSMVKGGESVSELVRGRGVEGKRDRRRVGCRAPLFTVLRSREEGKAAGQSQKRKKGLGKNVRRALEPPEGGTKSAKKNNRGDGGHPTIRGGWGSKGNEGNGVHGPKTTPEKENHPPKPTPFHVALSPETQRW